MINQISFYGFKYKKINNNSTYGANYSYKTGTFSRSNEIMSNQKNIKEQKICKSLAKSLAKLIVSSSLLEINLYIKQTPFNYCYFILNT